MNRRERRSQQITQEKEKKKAEQEARREEQGGKGGLPELNFDDMPEEERNKMNTIMREIKNTGKMPGSLKDIINQLKDETGGSSSNIMQKALSSAMESGLAPKMTAAEQKMALRKVNSMVGKEDKGKKKMTREEEREIIRERVKKQITSEQDSS